jgi:hypothetical protein
MPWSMTGTCLKKSLSLYAGSSKINYNVFYENGFNFGLYNSSSTFVLYIRPLQDLVLSVMMLTMAISPQATA